MMNDELIELFDKKKKICIKMFIYFYLVGSSISFFCFPYKNYIQYIQHIYTVKFAYTVYNMYKN